jgi:hypothetical protein
MLQGGKQFSLDFSLQPLNMKLVLLGHIFVQEVFSPKNFENNQTVQSAFDDILRKNMAH